MFRVYRSIYPERFKGFPKGYQGGTTFRTGECPYPMTAEKREKIAQTRQALFAEERARIKAGLPQKTRLRLISHRDCSMARYRMRKLHAYLPDKARMDLIWYNDTTERNKPLEAKYSAKYGIVFQKQETEAAV